MIDPVLKKLYQELKHGLQGTGENNQHSTFKIQHCFNVGWLLIFGLSVTSLGLHSSFRKRPAFFADQFESRCKVIYRPSNF